jgi:hypothetical protein
MRFRAAASFVLALSAVGAFGLGDAAAAPYADGLSMSVADEVLTFGACSIDGSGAYGATACGQLDVETLKTGTGTLFDPFVYGFQLTGPVSADGINSRESIVIDYRVKLADSNFILLGLEASLSGSPSTAVTFTEALSDAGGLVGSLMLDGTLPAESAFVSPGTAFLDVSSVVSVTGACGSDPCNNAVSSISQLFPQDGAGHVAGVPEPSTIWPLGAVVFGLAGMRGIARSPQARPREGQLIRIRI